MSAPLFGLDGRRAFVTGASRGIGRAIACSLAQAGAELILHGRDEAALSGVVEAIRAAGSKASALTGELSDRTATRHLADRVLESGPVDILVNNAGINIRNELQDLADEEWDRVMEIDLSSVFLLSKEFARGMLDRRWGRIINIGSIMSTISRPGILAYTSAKHGLVGLTKGLAAELGPAGVTVNAIGPGFVRTEATQVHKGGFAEMVVQRTPAKRWGEPSDIAGAAVFLASDAAAYVNGHLLVVDGGFSVSI